MCFFVILKCFLMDGSLFFKNRFVEIGSRSLYKEFRVFLFPMAIKIKLDFGLIPIFFIASEICLVKANLIRISVSSLFESSFSEVTAKANAAEASSRRCQSHRTPARTPQKAARVANGASVGSTGEDASDVVPLLTEVDAGG